jgi:hypothetical protein
MFFGGVRNVVTVLVIPVKKDGTKVGGLVLICERRVNGKIEAKPHAK